MALALTACAETTPTSPPLVVTPSGTSIDVTPYTQLSEVLPSAMPDDYADAYTRLVVTAKTAKTGSNRLPYHSRNALLRYLWGLQTSVTVTATASAGNFKSTVSLLSLEHKSTSDAGEQWIRTVTQDVRQFPLFLVAADGHGATPEITIKLKGSVDYSSHFASTALQTALAVANNVSGQAALVTELSKDTVQKRADAIDTAISSLFDKGLEEIHVTSDDIRRWAGDGGIKLDVYLPDTASKFSMNNLNSVGSWTLGFDFPRPSAFVDWRYCGQNAVSQPRCETSREKSLTRIYQEVDPAKVLTTSLTTGENALGQIGSYLSQKQWFKSALVDMSGNSDADAGEFCRHIRTDMVAVGLSSVDADITVWAVATAMTDIPDQFRSKLKSNAICKASLDPVSTGRKVQS